MRFSKENEDYISELVGSDNVQYCGRWVQIFLTITGLLPSLIVSSGLEMAACSFQIWVRKEFLINPVVFMVFLQLLLIFMLLLAQW